MQVMKVLDRRDETKAGVSSRSHAIARRILRVEPLGDPWRGKVFAGIRLKGRWLVKAGFPPGQRVTVIVRAPGAMQLRIVPQSESAGPRAPEQEQTHLVLEFPRGAEMHLQPKE